MRTKLLLLPFLLLFLTLSGCDESGQAPPKARNAHTNPSRPLDIKGLIFSTYGEQGSLTQRISAKQLMVKPRKFGVFRVKSVNEVVFVAVEFEFYRQFAEDGNSKDDSSLAAGMAEGMYGLSELKGIGRLTRAAMVGIKMRVLSQGKETFSLLAESGEIELKSKKTSFENVRFSLPANQSILEAKKSVWDKELQAFVVAGEYVLQTPKGEQRGRGAAIKDDGSLMLIRTRGVD